MINALHKIDVVKDVSTSCREMVCQAMCKNGAVNATQWNTDCIYGTCKQCPMFKIVVPQAKEGQLIMYSMWKYGIDEKKKAKQLKKNLEKKNPGKVFRLFSVTETIDEAINNFLKLIPKMKDHIFSAYCQWNAHVINRQNLCSHYQ